VPTYKLRFTPLTSCIMRCNAPCTHCFDEICCCQTLISHAGSQGSAAGTWREGD
jgi:hypothetical protein